MTDERDRARFFLEAGWGWWMEHDNCFDLWSDAAEHYRPVEPSHPRQADQPAPPIDEEPLVRRFLALLTPQKLLGS